MGLQERQAGPLCTVAIQNYRMGSCALTRSLPHNPKGYFSPPTGTPLWGRAPPPTMKGPRGGGSPKDTAHSPFFTKGAPSRTPKRVVGEQQKKVSSVHMYLVQQRLLHVFGINGIRLMRSCLTRKVICMHPAVTTSSIELVESVVSALQLQ